MTVLYDDLIPWLKYLVPALATLLLALGVLSRRRGRRLGQAVTAGLVVVAALSLMDYTASHVRYQRYFNPYEFFHYYLGTRYAPELGYYDLYNGVVAAEREMGRPSVTKVRDLESGKHVPIDAALKEAPRVKGRFSTERWEEFRRDVQYFRSKVSTSLWEKMLEDKGYNATPVWTMVGGSLANAVPTTSERGLQGLALVDAGLWVAAFSLVGWAFGPRPLLLVVIMLGTHYVMSHAHMKASFLRVDWICCLLGAMAFLKKGWHRAAGALVACAGLSRVFPFIFAFGPAVALVAGLARARRAGPGGLAPTQKAEIRDAAYFLGSLALTTTALLAASVPATSIEYWREFLGKIGHHAGSFTAWRIGFIYVFSMAWDGDAIGGLSIERYFKLFGWLYVLIQVGVLAVATALVLRLREAWERLAFGFVLMFFLTGPTYYYYVVLLVPTLWLAARADEPGRAAILSWMFATSIIANIGMGIWDRSYPLFFTISVCILAQILAMAVLIRREARPAGALDQALAPSRAAAS